MRLRDTDLYLVSEDHTQRQERLLGTGDLVHGENIRSSRREDRAKSPACPVLS
jgi:hypothetical protein